MAGKPRTGAKKQWKRKPRARKSGGYKTNNIVGRSLNPIPQRSIVKMKYCADVSTNSLTGQYYFNLNSIFDPDRSATGHQPYGRDTYASLYNRYRVIACSWVITTSSVNAVMLAAQPANEVLSFAGIAEMRENPRTKFIVQNAGGATVRLMGKTYIPSLVGRTKAQYMADDRYQAQVDADPAELAILNILTATGAGVSLGSQVVNVTLEYTVEFFDVKHLTQS